MKDKFVVSYESVIYKSYDDENIIEKVKGGVFIRWKFFFVGVLVIFDWFCVCFILNFYKIML